MSMDMNKARYNINEEESILGIYVWEMPDGRWIGDDDGNFLSVTAKTLFWGGGREEARFSGGSNPGGV